MCTLQRFLEYIETKKLFWAILNQLILSGAAVAIIIILSNVLDAQVFGRTRFLAAVLAIFAFFSLPGIGPVILQQMPIYSNRGFRRALAVQLKWGAGATVGALLFAVVFQVQGDVDLARAFAISGILAPVANLYLMPGTALAGLHKFKEKAMYDGVIVSCVVLAAWYGALTTGTVFGTMAWYFATQSVVTLLALYLVSKKLTQQAGCVFNAESDARYGKQLTLFQLPFTLLPALEKVLIFLFLGPGALAVFIIAFLPIEHIRNAYRNTLQFYILPHLRSPDENQDLRHLLWLALWLSVGGSLIIVIFAMLLLPVLFPGFDGAQPFMFLSALIPLSLPAYVFILKILFERRVERLYSYAFITVLTDILIFTILTSLFDLEGAVIAKILMSFVAAGVGVVLYKTNGTPVT